MKQERKSNLTAVSNHPPRLLYPRKEAAFQLGISVRAIDYLISRGELPVRRIGGRVLIAHQELEKFASRDHATHLVDQGREVAA
jgi:excisionase family DNA binding protein